jgi:hypothetical protein
MDKISIDYTIFNIYDKCKFVSRKEEDLAPLYKDSIFLHFFQHEKIERMTNFVKTRYLEPREETKISKKLHNLTFFMKGDDHKILHIGDLTVSDCAFYNSYRTKYFSVISQTYRYDITTPKRKLFFNDYSLVDYINGDYNVLVVTDRTLYDIVKDRFDLNYLITKFPVEDLKEDRKSLDGFYFYELKK